MRPTLLLVDSESAFRQRLTESLEAKGYRVLVTNKPSEALHLLLKEPIAFILIEGLLPEMNGHKLIQRIREQGHRASVIFVSALSVFVRDIKIFRELTRELNVYKVLSKPLNLDELLMYIEHLVPPPDPALIPEITAEVHASELPAEVTAEARLDEDVYPTEIPQQAPYSEDIIFVSDDDLQEISEEGIIDLDEADEISEIEELDELFPEVGPPIFNLDVPRSERSGAVLDTIDPTPHTPPARNRSVFGEQEQPVYQPEEEEDAFSEQTMFSVPSIPLLLGQLEEQQQKTQRKITKAATITNPLLPDPDPEPTQPLHYEAQDAVTSGDMGVVIGTPVSPSPSILPRITRQQKAATPAPVAVSTPKHEHLDELESQLYELLQLISSAKQSYFPQEPLQTSYHLVQQLYGIVGALENNQISEVLAEIEQALWTLLFQNPENTTPYWQSLLDRVEWCLLTVEYLQQTSPVQVSASEYAQMRPETTMLVVGQKAQAVQTLIAWGQDHRVRVLASDDWEEIQKIIENHRLDVLFLDVSLSRDGMNSAVGQAVRQETALINNGILWLEWIRSREGMQDVPVLFLTDQAELHHRILASYITPSQLLSQPLRKQAWLDALHRLAGHQTIRRSKILLTEDESGFAKDVEQTLTQAGFDLHMLSSPLHLFDSLEKINPDLLLLSLSVPGFSGLDLCRVVRSTPRWSDLTTILLSPILEGKLRTTALQIGFHDIITQSMKHDEITALVQLRLQRTHIFQQQRYRDPHSGLFQRHVFLDRAAASLAEAKAFQRPFSLCLLQLQGWEQIAKQHGFDARQLAFVQLIQTIQNQVRPFDLTGRLEENLLAIALPTADATHAQDLLRRIFEQFYQNPIPSKEHQSFTPTIVSGLAEHNDPNHTIDAILDRALQQIPQR
ncbi:MAG: response regulator [Myxococcales bacterium]|nr:response regulator [Myxococcales bacterium]